MMSGKAILFSEMAPDPSWETRFNAWYDEEHIPDRMCLPGFLGVQRYRAQDGTYLVVYEMAGMEALATPGYGLVKTQPSERTKWMLQSVTGFTRNLGTVLSEAGNVEAALDRPHCIAAVFVDVPASRLDAFDDHIATDHFAPLIASSTVLAARSFALSVAEPEPYSRLLIHYVAPPEAHERTSPASPIERLEDWGKVRSTTFRTWGGRVSASS